MTQFMKWMEEHKSAWRDDNEFKAKRKEEWKIIEGYLKDCGVHVQKKKYRVHKEYFMKGMINKRDDSKSMDDTYMKVAFTDNGGSFFFMMWYYPKNDLKIFNNLVNIASGPGVIEGARTNLWSNQMSSNFTVVPDEYGVLGGRQEAIFRALFPSLDFNEKKKIGNQGTQPIVMGPHLGTVLHYFLPSCSSVLFGDKKKFNSAGQYLWDYLDFGANQLTKEEFYSMLEERGGGKLKSFSSILYRAKYQGDTLGFASDTPEAVSLANKIKQKYENRELCRNLLDIWDNVDELYKKTEASSLFYDGPEEEDIPEDEIW